MVRGVTGDHTHNGGFRGIELALGMQQTRLPVVVTPAMSTVAALDKGMHRVVWTDGNAKVALVWRLPPTRATCLRNRPPRILCAMGAVPF